MADSYPRLLRPLQVGSVRLRNRTVLLPMGSRHPTEGAPNDRDIAWHEERARGGVGLVITGGTVVHPSSDSRGGDLLRAWRRDTIDAHRRRAEAVHRHGAAIVGQILHLGREATGAQLDLPQPAPSAVRSPREAFEPHELSAAEIEEIVEHFALSAGNLVEAGYDGIEIHGAHGYLVAQFLSAASNRRTDRWGEPVRFLLEIVGAVRDRIGRAPVLGVRMSADEEVEGGIRLPDTLGFSRALEGTGLVDYLSITRGMRSAYVKDGSWPHGVSVGYAAAVKDAVDLPVIVAGRITTPELAEQILAEGKADLVGLGRALIADPEFPAKAAAGQGARIRPCIAFVQDCRLAQGGAACAVNASAGRELLWPATPDRSGRAGRVVVVGGGPGGLEADRLAALRGHEVLLLERSAVLGGQVRTAARGPSRGELLGFVEWAERELHRLGVHLRPSTPAGVEEVVDARPDLVIVATGSTPRPPVVDGAVTVHDVLDGSGRAYAGTAIVVDDGAGFWPAPSAAELLALQGVRVTLLTPAPAIGLAIPHESIAALHRRLRTMGVDYQPFSRVAGGTPGAVRVVDTTTGAERTLSADTVVEHTSQRAVTDLLTALPAALPPGVAVHGIGDCLSPRRITSAVLDANRVVRAWNPVPAPVPA